MRLLTRLLEPKTIAHAHCDLPCGVYDPAQARIEAESVKACMEKYPRHPTSNDFRARESSPSRSSAPTSSSTTSGSCGRITSRLNTFSKCTPLHELFCEGDQASRGRQSQADRGRRGRPRNFSDDIAEIDRIFWETKKA